jgi:hypothetical protein
VVLDARYGGDSRDLLDRLALEAAALRYAVFDTQGPALHAARKVPEPFRSCLVQRRPD